VKGLFDDEKCLVDENSMIMYQTGKGINHLVPVIVPPDTVEAVKKIASPEERQQVGIPADNPYLFPSVSTSDSHVSWLHAIITRIAAKAGVPDKSVTATKMRHLTRTLYAASRQIPEAQWSAFYRHMGHSKQIMKTYIKHLLLKLKSSCLVCVDKVWRVCIWYNNVVPPPELRWMGKHENIILRHENFALQCLQA